MLKNDKDINVNDISFLLNNNSGLSLEQIFDILSKLKSVKPIVKKREDYALLNDIKVLEKKAKNRLYILKSSPSEIINTNLPINLTYSSDVSIVSFLINELHVYFTSLGYKHIPSNDVENTKVVFDDLNIDNDHPSRKETFYFSLFNDSVLRPHTTSVDINILKKNSSGDFFTYGLVYRRDNDKNHLPAFYQFELLSIKKESSVFLLKEILLNALSFLFNRLSILACEDIFPKTRFRTHYFPYTSPSYEIDVQCFCSSKEECSFCDHGWLEILGCGLLSKKITEKKCMAAGIGISRLAMLMFNFFSENKITNISSMHT